MEDCRNPYNFLKVREMKSSADRIENLLENYENDAYVSQISLDNLDEILYKSEKISEESVQASKAISILGGKVDRQVDFTLPGSDIYRNVYVIKKEKHTPKKYPRKAGLPSKEPL